MYLEEKFKEYFQTSICGQSLKIAEALKTIPKDERKLELVLKRHYKFGKKLDDKKMFEKARSFSQGDLKLLRSRRALRESVEEHPYLSIQLLFIKECPKIQRPLKKEFKIYNLARSIDSDSLSRVLDKVPWRFKKLNEFNRICLLWQNHKITRREM